MSTEERIRTRLNQAIQEQVFPGAVVGFVRGNGERIIVAEGTHTYAPNAQTTKTDSMFDVASVTKSIPTASLALKLIEEGKLNIEDEARKYLPELDETHHPETLVKHLLTFTILLDLPSPLSTHKFATPEFILNLLHTTKLKHPAGSTYQYSNAPSILLGLIVEKIYGKPLDQAAEEVFFKPLGMTDSAFYPTDKTRIVPTEVDNERGGLLHGTVHDESAYALQKQITPGNAGLFTTVPDLLTFLEMLLHKGTLRGTQYFKPETVALMHTNQIVSIGQSAGLGWELNQPRFMGKYATGHTFGKTGFTGCLVVCDIEKQLAFAMLSNYVHPHRKPNADLINQVRRDISDIILASASTT